MTNAGDEHAQLGRARANRRGTRRLRVTRMARVFIGVGSNISPEQNVRRALRLLARDVRVIGVSTVYRTAALDRPEQPDFLNCVVEVETDIAPVELKHSVLRRVEDELGRIRGDDKYAPRTIDLDVLVYDGLTVEADDLMIPDPDIERRPFLAVPLCELAPELVLPNSGRRVCDAADAFADHDMQALLEYTEIIRKDIEHGR